MTIRFIICIAIGLSSLTSLPLVRAADAAPTAADKPNILFILADDLGKEWIGCYGAEGIETPHIDALAAGGMRFENAYSMPQCTPTRVTLLTGQYPHRHGWTNHFDVPRWGSGGHFDASLHASFARVAKEAGYMTAAAGKWQIDDFRIEPRAMAEAGFDAWCMWTGGEGGNPPSNERYFNPYIHTTNGQSKTYKDRFGPDVFCDFLIDFMHTNRDRPMLLYYPMVLTHGPATATPAELDAAGLRGRFSAMVRYTDKLVGRLVAALDQNNLRKRTIIIFTTDNGSPRGVRNRRLGRDVSGAKSQHNEAGAAMPFIVNGPGLVPAGVVTDALTDFTDVLPTIAELTGGKLDKDRVVDGHSLAPLILGKAKDSPRHWIVSMGGGPAAFRDNRIATQKPYDERVIRDKQWKLWIDDQGRPQKLFDLKSDPWEQSNLLYANDPAAQAALARLYAVIKDMPAKDAWPRYRPNPARKWDKFKYVEAVKEQ